MNSHDMSVVLRCREGDEGVAFCAGPMVVKDCLRCESSIVRLMDGERDRNLNS